MQSKVQTTDKDNRLDYRQRLQSKIEAALNPPAPAPEIESAPVEIIEKYSRWVPARLASEPVDELLPEFKKEEPFIPQGDVEKRASLKQNILNKVSESLLPLVEEVEPPVEIIEKYSQWAPARLIGGEPAETIPPEFPKRKLAIPDRETEKRVSIKQRYANKISESLTPLVESESELESEIEVIDRYAQGIPQRSFEEPEPLFTDLQRDNNPWGPSVADEPKRTAFKNRLEKRVQSITTVKPDTSKPIEIVDYSQRSITPYGLDFEETKRDPLPIVEPQKLVEGFTLVPEEPLVPVLRLPENYQELDEKALYGILIRTPGLQHSAESANLALDILTGRSVRKAEFEIISDSPVTETQNIAHPVVKNTIEIQDQFKPQDEAKRTEAVQRLMGKIDQLLTSHEEDSEEFESGVFEISETIDLTVSPSVLRTDLLLQGLKPERVDKILSYLFNPAPVKTMENIVEPKEELFLDLPKNFSQWKPNEQYIYLTKELKLTPETANTIVFEHVGQKETG